MRKSAIAGIVALVGLSLAGCFPSGIEEPLQAVIVTEPSPPRGDPPLTVQFSAAGSRGEIEQYIWDFGDGESASGRTVQHTYNLPGNYVVTLTVIGPQSEDSAQVTVHVNSHRPVIEYFRVDRAVVHATHAVYFYAGAYDPDGEVRFFHWDFGNGETATTSTGDISYTYESPGSFIVSLQVEDDNGDLSDPHSLRLEVLPPCPCD